jgi:hypothetical protein
VDGSQSSRELEDLQKGRADRTWHRFGAGLGGSNAFVSRSIFCLKLPFLFIIAVYCSCLRIGERIVFYTFWSDHVAFQAPSDLRTRGELVTLHLEGCYSFWSVVLGEVTRPQTPYVRVGEHLCVTHDWLGELPCPALVRDKR